MIKNINQTYNYMAFKFENLDTETRSFMLKELGRDISENTLWKSDHLSPEGILNYPNLIRSAAETGTEETFAAALLGQLNPFEKPRLLKFGKYSKPPTMRSNAHQMLAEGEFNRLYIRGLCLRAVSEGISSVIVYRGKEVASPRAESEQLIGSSISSADLLEDLRNSKGKTPALLPFVNSGLTIRLT